MKKMPSFRFGKMKQYGGESEPHFEPADRVCYDAYFERFKNLYFISRVDAEAALTVYKMRMRREAEDGQKYIDATDPDMARRMDKRSCTQEDARKPYYAAIQKAHDAVRHWEVVRDFIVGEWGEPPEVCRLNTLLSDEGDAGADKVRELDEKMDYFGECEIAWSCHGHTRAEWQSEADAAWLAKNRPTWKVTSRGESLEVRK